MNRASAKKVEVEKSDINISAFSTAMFSTWIFIEPWRLLLDAGDGVCAGLLQKSRKVDTIAVTHADRDHLAGLFQLQQLNARNGLPRILYPRDCGSFPAIAEFVKRFDPDTGGQITWQPVVPGDAVSIAKDLRLQVLSCEHFSDAGNKIKSVSYRLARLSRKLKPEFRSLSQAELGVLAKAQGSESLSEEIERPLLGYSGDTRVCSPELWRGCEVLIHESTFLRAEDMESGVQRHNQHCVLKDVLKQLQPAPPSKLVLSHFSVRYSADEIRNAVREAASSLAYNGSICIIPPGEIVRDVLTQNIVWPV